MRIFQRLLESSSIFQTGDANRRLWFRNGRIRWMPLLASFRRISAFKVAGIVLIITAASGAIEFGVANDNISAGQQSSNEESAAPSPGTWSSFRNSPQLTGIATSSLPDKLELLWKIPVQDGVTASAAIVGDRVFVGTYGGELLCLDRATGDRIWVYYSAPKPEPDTFIPAFKSSPTVTADSIYLGDEDGVFHAVDRATGENLWKFQTGAEIISSATIVGDRVLFGSYDNSLYCLSTVDGAKLWQFETDGYVNCTPAIAGEFTFVTGCDEHLRMIDIATGEQKFDMPLYTYLIASPAVIEDLLYVGTYASEVIAVDWRQQEVIWRYKDDKREFPYHSSAAVTDNRVVVGGRDKQLHCIDRATGEKVWVFATKGRVDSSPVIVGSRVFVGSSDRNLYEFDLESGEQLWRYNAGQEITSSPAVGEGCLVIGTEGSTGYVLCFGAKEK